MTATSILSIVIAALQFYTILIVVYVLLSWLQSIPLAQEARRVLGTICEPYLGLFRRLVPSLGGSGIGIDLSPIAAILVLQVVIQLIRRLVVS